VKIRLEQEVKERISELARQLYPRGQHWPIRIVVQLSLQQAALNYTEEIQRAQRDKKTAKGELERALKMTDRLSAQLNELSKDTRFFINRRTFQQAVRKTGVPLGIPDRKVSLDKIKDDLSKAKDTLELSLSSLRKTGRPSDDALDGLLLQAFLIWARLLRRPFKLDWTPQGEPLTEAAAWCERVCRAADPEIAPTRIRTAALKVRERLPENSNLYNPIRILKTYFKRSGWLDKRN
jgi:hypothetical protein